MLSLCNLPNMQDFVVKKRLTLSYLLRVWARHIFMFMYIPTSTDTISV